MNPLTNNIFYALECLRPITYLKLYHVIIQQYHALDSDPDKSSTRSPHPIWPHPIWCQCHAVNDDVDGTATSSPSSKYRAFRSAPHSAVTGPVEFHTFSKWNQRQTLCRPIKSLEIWFTYKKTITVPISLHAHYTLNVTEITRPRYHQKIFCSSARHKSSHRAPIVIILSHLFAANNPLMYIHEVALENT
jgi:hypothetical protein